MALNNVESNFRVIETEVYALEMYKAAKATAGISVLPTKWLSC